jgi:hypothetical protein
MTNKYSFGNGESRGKIASPNLPHFAAQIADFGLNYCILNVKAKNNISGRK